MKHTTKIVIMVVWIVIIFVLTGYPALEPPTIKEFPIDKLYHLIIFFILGFLQFRVLKTTLFFIVGISIIALAEVQQLIIPGREFELLDMLAGLIGLCIAFAILKRRVNIQNAVPKA